MRWIPFFKSYFKQLFLFIRWSQSIWHSQFFIFILILNGGFPLVINFFFRSKKSILRISFYFAIYFINSKSYFPVFCRDHNMPHFISTARAFSFAVNIFRNAVILAMLSQCITARISVHASSESNASINNWNIFSPSF